MQSRSDNGTEKIKKARLFVAVNLPSELKNKFAELQAEFKAKHNVHGLRWAHAEQIHLTLKFLGYVPESAISDIQNAISVACEKIGRLDLVAAGLGCFPNARAPRVVWAGLTGNLAGLGVLQKCIETATVAWAEPEA
ncbi:MAG TPA: RNA 2',3'-cyclic phosphodiesterase, partial [Verrucomicrobiae bacterium]